MSTPDFVPFSELDTLFIARELQNLRGRRVEALVRLTDTELVLLLEGGSAVLISTHPQRYRVHQITQVQGLGSPIAAGESHLKGLRLHRIAVPRGERMLLLEFVGTSRLGEPISRVLAVELMGKHSQVVLLGPDRRILWTLKTVTPQQSRVRSLQAGGTYQPPPAKPWSLTDPQRNPEALRHHAPRVFPVPSGEDPVAFLGTYLQAALRAPQPGLYRWQGRWMVLPHPVPGVSLHQATPSHSAAWELLIRQVQAPGAPGEPSRVVQRLRQELTRLAQYERWNQVAEAILLRRSELLQTGTLRIALPDGTEETVTLEPGETPEGLAARYREQAARWRRGYEKVRQRLQVLASSTTPPSPEPRTSEAPASSSPRYHVYRSPSGFPVYVGKNARGNEEITFHRASPDDYFFHARGVPGAHVILKTGKQRPSEADLVFAARLALQHSRAAADGKGEVAYTQVKYLRKPRGAAPGLVILTRERVLQVRL